MIKGVIAALMAAIGYGIMPVLSKLLITSQMDSKSLIVGQGMLGAILLLAIIRYKGLSIKLTHSQAKAIALIGMADGVTMLLMYEAYARIDVGIATMAHFIYPILVMLIMSIVFKEKISRYKILAIIFAMSGMVIMTNIQSGNKIGFVLAVLSGICFAIYNVANQKSEAGQMSVLVVAFYNLVMISVSFFIISMVLGTMSFPANIGEWILLVSTGVIKIGGVCLSIYAMHKVGSTTTSLLSMIELVTAVIAGIIVFEESIVLKQIVGGLGIMAGSVLVIWDSHISEKLYNQKLKNR